MTDPKKALGVPSPSFVRTRTGRLAYQSWGEGLPLVCLHAVGHGGGDFVQLAARLAGTGVRVIAFDLPGHGHSEATTAARSDAYADVVLDALDALHIERPFLLGNSIGGAMAVRVAAARPARGVVLCDSAGLVQQGRVEHGAIRAMAWFFAQGARGAAWFPTLYGLYYRMVLPKSPERRKTIVAAGSAMAPVLRDAWTGFVDHDLRGVAESLRVPVLAAWARGDRIIPLRASMPTLKRMREVRVLRFEGGHAPFLEDGDRFAAALRQFLAAHQGGRTASLRNAATP